MFVDADGDLFRVFVGAIVMVFLHIDANRVVARAAADDEHLWPGANGSSSISAVTATLTVALLVAFNPPASVAFKETGMNRRC